MNEYKKGVKEKSLKELIDDCIDYSKDSYYTYYFNIAYEEVQNRLKEGENNKHKL